MAIVKIRKNRKCDLCNKLHKKGSEMYYERGRAPRFGGDHEAQIGIQYWQIWACSISCAE
jgi:hypothetical protein